LLRDWESEMSRAFSSVWGLGGKKRQPDIEKGTTTREKKPRRHRNPSQSKPGVTLEFRHLGDPTIPYTIDEAIRHIEVNLDHEHVCSLPKGEEDPTRRQALTDVAMDAFVEMKTKTMLAADFKDAEVANPLDLLKRYAETARME